MIKLSKRMEAVASMVTRGNRLADVGTDHGYVPIALMEQGIIPSAIAMDINQGPLDKAREHIAAFGIKNIQTRLSDGVADLQINEVDTILIAGMGGELVMRILSMGNEVCHSVKELVLQPQSDLDKVRIYLRENGYKIIDEDMVLEDGKFYPMMKVLPSSDQAMAMDNENQAVCDIYGPFLLKKANPVLKQYLEKEHKMLSDILDNLEKQEKTDAIIARIGQIQQSISYNEAAKKILGA